MLLIYGKGKVGKGVAKLCDNLRLDYEIRDDSDALSSYDAYEAIIPSPGISPTHPIYTTGKILPELDFAYQYLPEKCTVIAVTGTDGKSTTSWILYSILEKEFSGKKSVYLSGNFDIPFSETVTQIREKGEKRAIIVVEVSSFMSAFIEKFRPDYTLFTNIKPDHLNWHRDLQDYVGAKMRLLTQAKKKSIINKQIIDFIGENSLNLTLPLNSRIFEKQEKNIALTPVPNTGQKPRDTTNGEDIIISGRRKYKLSETQFSGIHNAMNILGSALVANEMGLCAKHIKRYLKEISGLSHRLEKIGEKNGITFVEDSKSTSSQSLEAALGSYGLIKNLLLIVGGSDKGDSFDHLSPKFQERVKAMACIGATKEKFIEIAQKENIPYIATDVLVDAVEFLWRNAKNGDVLMLSPGCASFGLFRDYFDRANQFREIIKKISE